MGDSKCHAMLSQKAGLGGSGFLLACFFACLLVLVCFASLFACLIRSKYFTS